MHADTGPRTGSFGALGAIVAGALILQVASTILNTVLPLQLAVANQPPWLIGLVGSAYSVGFLVGCFRIPSLIRRIGHIRGFAVFSAVQASLALSFALLPAEWWGIPRLIMGVAGAGHAICIESWISGQASAGQRGKIFGAYQILNRLSLIGSQIGVGYIALQTHDIFLIASAAFSIALIPLGLTRARAPEAPDAVSMDIGSLWRHAPAAVVGCVYVGLMGGAMTNVTPAYGILIGLDQKAAIMLTAAIQIGALLVQYPMGMVADKLDSRIIMLTTASAVVAAVIGLGAVLHFGTSNDRMWFYGLFALIGGSFSLYTVAVTHAYLRMGQERAVGLSAALLLLWGIGSAIGPLAAAGFMQVVGPHGLLVYAGTLSFGTAAYLAWRMLKKPPPAQGEISAMPPVIPDLSPNRR